MGTVQGMLEGPNIFPKVMYIYLTWFQNSVWFHMLVYINSPNGSVSTFSRVLSITPVCACKPIRSRILLPVEGKL